MFAEEMVWSTARKVSVSHTFGGASEQLFPASENHGALALWCVVQLSTHLKPDSWGK